MIGTHYFPVGKAGRLKAYCAVTGGQEEVRLGAVLYANGQIKIVRAIK